MKKAILLAFAAAALAACATKASPPPQIRTVEVAIPTPVPCVSAATPEAPTYPDTDAALKSASGPAERYSLIQAGRVLRSQRLDAIEPLIRACRQ